MAAKKTASITKTSATGAPVSAQPAKKPRSKKTTKYLDRIYVEMEAEIKKFWPWAQMQFGTTGESLLTGIDSKYKDKSTEFGIIFGELHPYAVSWSPVVMNQALIGIKSDPVPFRRNFQSRVKWLAVFDELKELGEDIILSNFIDVPNSNISTVQIMCFNPQLVQAIDYLVQQAIQHENDEYLDKLRDGAIEV